MINLKNLESAIFSICVSKSILMQKEEVLDIIKIQLKTWLADFTKRELIFTEKQFMEALHKMSDNEIFFNNMLPALDVFKKYLKAKTHKELEHSLQASKNAFYASINNLLNCLSHEHNNLFKNEFHCLEQKYKETENWSFICIDEYFNNKKKISLEQIKPLAKKLLTERKNDHVLFHEKLKEIFEKNHKSEILLIENNKPKEIEEDKSIKINLFQTN